MAKQSAYAKKLSIYRKLDLDLQRRFTIQQMEDIFLILMNQKYGFGEKRLQKLRSEIRQEVAEWTAFALEDDMSDRQLNYTKGKIDRYLQKCFPSEKVRWEDRYEI